MEMMEFDRENVRLIAKGEVEQVEKRLLRNYRSAKKSGEQDRLLDAISSLAHFYARPFKEDLAKAERYFRERFRLFPDVDSALELVMFSHFVLDDPQRTIRETGRVRSFYGENRTSNLRQLYDAVAIEGQAFLSLGLEQDAIRNLQELLGLAVRNPRRVPFGDELNFVKQMVERGLSTPACKSLLEMARRGVHSPEYAKEMGRLLQRL